MPTYDYFCHSCGYEFEHFQRMSVLHLERCPKCNGKVERKIGGGAGLLFKGSGFYITDYKKRSTGEEKKTKYKTTDKPKEKSKENKTATKTQNA